MPVEAFVPQPSTLYVVATPIGNLRDITLRALDVLRGVDQVAAEDTRVTQRLFAAYGIRKPIVALHEHNETNMTPKLIDAMRAGQSIALVSDAGTPGVSDPGAYLVRAARASGLVVVPIPGPSAVSAALSVAGLAHSAWLFFGFLPAKPTARRQILSDLVGFPYPIVFYEAPHRVVDSVADLATVFGPQRKLLLARELTKCFEQIVELTLGEAGDWLAADADRQRGEFVLIVDSPPRAIARSALAAEQVLDALLSELPPTQAARLAAKLTGQPRRSLYARAINATATQRD